MSTIISPSQSEGLETSPLRCSFFIWCVCQSDQVPAAREIRPVRVIIVDERAAGE